MCSTFRRSALTRARSGARLTNSVCSFASLRSLTLASDSLISNPGEVGWIATLARPSFNRAISSTSRTKLCRRVAFLATF